MKYINEAGWDRIIRLALGLVMLALGWAEVITGTAGSILKFLGFVPLATGLLGWCPLYAIFRFRTTGGDASPIGV